MIERHPNGSKVRMDGKGDAWALEHRTKLGKSKFMSDIDAFAGTLSFATNGQDRVFAEYAPDPYTNAGKTVREFGLVALFDRKSTRHAAEASHSILSLAFYLSVCRVYASFQPFAPHFYFVCGEVEPWEMIRIDINTGKETAAFEYRDKPDWAAVWAKSGLMEGRNMLNTWLQTPREPQLEKCSKEDF